MNSAEILTSDDFCRRKAFLEKRWQPHAVTPTQALHESIERGLTDDSDSDSSDVASEHLMELATTRGIDSNQEDLLGQAEHLAGIASFVTYLLRPATAWKRLEVTNLPNGTHWTPTTFLDPSESHLRRLILCSKWDAYRQVQEEHDWRTLESAVYGVPMDLVVVVLGPERNGRRHGPLCKGWTHPVSKTLRFRKRDGTGFDGAWEPVFREQSDFSREDWLDALVEDGLLLECVVIHQTPALDRASEIVHLAESKITRLRDNEYPPEPQLSRCFDRFHPCPFRSCCPRGLEPSEELGFISALSLPLHDHG